MFGAYKTPGPSNFCVKFLFFFYNLFFGPLSPKYPIFQLWDCVNKFLDFFVDNSMTDVIMEENILFWYFSRGHLSGHIDTYFVQIQQEMEKVELKTCAKSNKRMSGAMKVVGGGGLYIQVRWYKLKWFQLYSFPPHHSSITLSSLLGHPS